MKRISKREYERLQHLNTDICALLSDKSKQSTRLYRGDLRAIQWAAWWIREVVKEQAQGTAPRSEA